MACFTLAGGVILFGQAEIDMNGYWAFHVKDGGVNYFRFQQTGDNVTTVAPAGRGAFGRGGRGLSGTLRNRKLHLASMPAQAPSATAGQTQAAGRGAPPGQPKQPRETVYDGVVENANRIAAGIQVTGREPLKGWFERVTREEAFPARMAPADLRDVPDNGLARTPPMGWNSWNKFQDVFDNATVRQMADAIVSSGMAESCCCGSRWPRDAAGLDCETGCRKATKSVSPVNGSSVCGVGPPLEVIGEHKTKELSVCKDATYIGSV